MGGIGEKGYTEGEGKGREEERGVKGEKEKENRKGEGKGREGE